MNRVTIPNNAFGFPMPVAIVGTCTDEKPNYMAVGWMARVNLNPPLIAIALNNNHKTSENIRTNKEFGINIPSRDHLAETDAVGLVSGRLADKGRLFKSFFRELKKAPLIEECPVNLECRLVQEVPFATNTLFVAEIVGAYAREDALEQGKVSMKKVAPILLSMPDNQYWDLGDVVGKAWGSGRAIADAVKVPI